MTKPNFKMVCFSLSGFFTCLFLLVSSLYADDINTPNTHLKFRNDTAIYYLNPESHLKLARYHYDMGNKVQAFFIAEHTRQIFGDEKFTPVFDRISAVKFDVFQSFEDEEEYIKYCHTHPDSIEAYVLTLYNKIKDSATGQNDADKLIEKALTEYPRQISIISMAARYYLKTKKDKEKALPLYIDLYFYDPHFYDGEYAEFRIKDITSSLKISWCETRQKKGISLQQLVAQEKNPRVLDVIISQAREKWDPSMVPALFTMLDNDDPSVQTGALHTLLEHPEDLSKNVDIPAMLKGDDLVKRAMASFFVVKCQNNKDYSLLKDNLDSGIELIQLDTIQALSMMGGEKGLDYLKANSPIQANEEIKALWKEQVSRGEK